MGRPRTSTALRLARSGFEPAAAAGADPRRIASENRRAACAVDLDPTDPRWVVAVRTRSQLQGDVLTPEGRDRVLRTARHLGLRPFDANLIIALVQDHARCRRPMADTHSMLTLIPGPSRRRGRPGLQLAAAVACGAMGTAIVIGWILGA